MGLRCDEDRCGPVRALGPLCARVVGTFAAAGVGYGQGERRGKPRHICYEVQVSRRPSRIQGSNNRTRRDGAQVISYLRRAAEDSVASASAPASVLGGKSAPWCRFDGGFYALRFNRCKDCKRAPARWQISTMVDI